MKFWRACVASALTALAGCGGSSSSSMLPEPNNGMARARFADGAPALEAKLPGGPGNICSCYLTVNGQTVVSQMDYGTITPFVNVRSGTASLTARNTEGYAVGPLKSASLTAGKEYTLVIVGSYPNYKVLTFAEPAQSDGAQLSLYEASPEVPKADFGTFSAGSQSDFKALGSATLGAIGTVSLGAHVTNLGGYAGKGSKPFTRGTQTPSQIDAFDSDNALPFQKISRLSLFLFDPNGNLGPVFGSLDR
jgi:Domain of unknown function (DUF4397)